MFLNSYYDRVLLHLQSIAESVFNSFPCAVTHVYVLGLCVIYAAARAGGEQLEQKSMIPSVAYLWLHQTMGLSAG